MTKKKVTKKKTVQKSRVKSVPQTDLPKVSLENALRIATAVREHGGTATPQRVAEALGMARTGGRFKNLSGSSVGYGLTTGGYNAKEIAITDLGSRAVKPLVDGDDFAAKKEAFLTPRIISLFLAKYDGDDIARDEISLNVLDDMGVPKSRGEEGLRLIKEGGQAFGLLQDVDGQLRVSLADSQRPSVIPEQLEEPIDDTPTPPATPTPLAAPPETVEQQPLKIFLAHGRHKAQLEEVKKLLDVLGLPYKVVENEPHAGRAISEKVAEGMAECTAGIFLFTADEELTDSEGKTVYRPSQNVVYELGAGTILYKRRIAICKQDIVDFPTNFKNLGYIKFGEEQPFDASALVGEILKITKSRVVF